MAYEILSFSFKAFCVMYAATIFMSNKAFRLFTIAAKFAFKL